MWQLIIVVYWTLLRSDIKCPHHTHKMVTTGSDGYNLIRVIIIKCTHMSNHVLYIECMQLICQLNN
jgi:hypothetical protein